MVAPLDEVTGKVHQFAIYADITKGDEYMHPVTGIELAMIKTPFWNECHRIGHQGRSTYTLKIVRSAGMLPLQKTNLVLIEGNHNWNYLVMQMPEKRGYKKEILQYAVG